MQVRDIDRVPSGSPAAVLFEADLPFRKTVTAALALAKRHLTLGQAKRIVERLMVGERVAVEIPMIEDRQTFRRDLEANGVHVEFRDPPDNVNVKAIREKTGLSQEEFALRYGLEVASLRNWEQGRTQPELAVRVLFRVIERNPRAVEEALTR
ncbi:MAG: helix-turn-helix domain-containing protein [Stellaceae bacterium]